MVSTSRCMSWASAVATGFFVFLILAGSYVLPGVIRAGATPPRSLLGLRSWSSPLNLSASSADSRAAALAVTRDGRVHVVWEEGDELCHSYREDGSWSDPSPLATGEQPSLASSSDGGLHLVFVNEIDDAYNIYYVHWDGSSWSMLPQRVSNTDSFSDSPVLAATSDGSLHALWTEDGLVYHGTSVDGGPWSYSAIADGTAPTVAAGGGNTVEAAWQAEDASGHYDVYRSQLKAETWSTPKNISNSPGYDSTTPDLSVQGDTPHLAWQEMTSRTAQVQYSRGPEWTQIDTLSESDSGAYAPSLAVDNWGERYVAWEETAFPYHRIRYARASGADATWASPTTLVRSASLSEQLEDISLSSDTKGVLHAVWTEGESEQGEILYTHKRFHDSFDAFLPLILVSGGQ